jgi:hypothetical protein
MTRAELITRRTQLADDVEAEIKARLFELDKFGELVPAVEKRLLWSAKPHRRRE